LIRVDAVPAVARPCRSSSSGLGFFPSCPPPRLGLACSNALRNLELARPSRACWQPVPPAGHGLGSLETGVSTEPFLALDSLAPAGFGIRGRSQQPMLPASPGLGSHGIEISEGPLLALDLQSWPLRGSRLAPSGFGSRISPRAERLQGSETAMRWFPTWGTQGALRARAQQICRPCLRTELHWGEKNCSWRGNPKS